MGIGRSTFYDTPDARARDLTIVAEMKMICDEFEAYGYRRVDAELRHRGIVVNAPMAEFGINTPVAIGFELVTNHFHLRNDGQFARASIGRVIKSRAADPH